MLLKELRSKTPSIEKPSLCFNQDKGALLTQKLLQVSLCSYNIDSHGLKNSLRYIKDYFQNVRLEPPVAGPPTV